MKKEKLIQRITEANSQVECLCELTRFEEKTTRNAFDFLLSVNKKRKGIIHKRLKKEWLGDATHPGVLQTLQTKYLRQYV